MDMNSASSASAATSSASSVANLTLGDPRCNSDTCLEFKTAHAASQAKASYYYQFEYGKWISYYYVIILFLFTIAYIYRLWTFRRTATKESRVTIVDKVVALYRSFTYRRISGAVGVYLGLPSYGLLALTLISLVLIMAMSFAIHPYYRRYRGFGSPPLAIRAGLMGVALTPLIFALAGKFNLVTLLTGISHEKLNVVHRYVSYACLILSIIHTVPYLINDGTGPTLFGLAGLRARWYAAGSYEFTGTPTFGILVFLCFFSIPYFRHRLYELFKYSHYAAAVTYLGLMFWHCGNEGNSWYYLYATVAIFVLSICGRLVFKTSSIAGKCWFDTKLATVQVLGPSMVRVSVFASPGMLWVPGQHVFLRFPSIRLLANHPFTIASIPTNRIAEPQEMVFLIRPYKGFTATLHSIAVASPSSELSLPIDVGGPYGGIGRALEKRYESVILIAGGGGISSVLPWLMHLSQKMRAGEKCLTQRVTLVWAVQHRDALSWIKEQLQQAVGVAPSESIDIHIYVTKSHESIDAPKPDFAGDISDSEKQLSGKNEALGLWETHLERPNLLNVIPAFLKFSRTVVLGCGPESMKIDIANAVAASQNRVLSGEFKDISLHTETFGW